MHKVAIEIFCIAQTRINSEATRKWLDRCGALDTPVPRVTGNEITCLGCEGQGCGDCHRAGVEKCNPSDSEVTDAGAVCGLCAKRCYMSFEPGLNPNVTRVRKVWHDYLSNILKSGHGSVTEHSSWTFAIEGVSRVFTGELNRHRAGVAISEGSMRYIRFDDIGYWEPHSLAEDSLMLMPTKRCKACKGSGKFVRAKDGTQRPMTSSTIPTGEALLTCSGCMGAGRLNTLTTEEFEAKKSLTRGMFEAGFREMESNYKQLCSIWDIDNMKAFDTKKKLTSMFRRLIGMGVATGGTWTFNTRALRHVIALRTSPHAEEEIAYVMSQIGKMMFENEPALFGDFTLDEATGCWTPANAKI